MSESSVTVYGIFSSRDGEIRYIGQTRGRIATRLGQHLMMLGRRLRSPLFTWMNEEIEAGFSLGVTKLIERAKWNEDEKLTIERYVAGGANLLNISKEELSQIRRESTLKNWEDPAYRERRAATVRRAMEDPDRRTANAARLRKATDDPEAQERRRKRMAEVMESPEYRQKMKAAMTAKWQDPEYKERIKAAVAAGKDEKWRRKISAAMKARVMTEEHKRNIAEGMKKAWAKKTRSGDADS